MLDFQWSLSVDKSSNCAVLEAVAEGGLEDGVGEADSEVEVQEVSEDAADRKCTIRPVPCTFMLAGIGRLCCTAYTAELSNLGHQWASAIQSPGNANLAAIKQGQWQERA